MTEQRPLRLIAYGIAGVLALVAAVKLLSPGGGSAASPPVRVDRPAGGAPGAAPGSAREVYVHVAGAVKRPGLYRVPRSSRVAAAVEAAGGPARKADLTGVNLAATVQDGQQVVVPRAGAGGGAAAAATSAGSGAGPAGSTAAGAAAGAGGAAGSGAKISLGSATAEQLDQLDGIGPTLAKRIVDYRAQHGGFHSIEELKQVDGIGDKRFQALRDALSP